MSLCQTDTSSAAEMFHCEFREEKLFLKGLGHELESKYCDKMDGSRSNKNLFWF